MSKTHRFAQYLAYIAAFSLLYPLCGLVMEGTAHLAGYPGFRSGHLSSGFVFSVLSVVPFAICQAIAAGATVRGLSLRGLLGLSCFFGVISHLLSALSIQMVLTQNRLSGVSVLISITAGTLLPYVAPILILALTGRKRPTREQVPSPGPESVSGGKECGAAVNDRQVVGAANPRQRYWFVLDLLLVGFLGFCSGLTDPFGLIAYRCGLHNDYVTEFCIVGLLVVLSVPAVLCLVALVLRMSITWPSTFPEKVAFG